MIYFTGDMHGAQGVRGLSVWREGMGLTRDDYLVICGDFGLVWYPEGNPRREPDEDCLDWLEGRPWTTLFVDGNHENHDLLRAMPEVPWRGGLVHEVRPHVLHLVRGCAFDLPVGDHAETLLAMGGASSHDKEWRIEGEDWWPSELPNGADLDRCRATLDRRGWEVDWVATHDIPGHLKPMALVGEPFWSNRWEDDRLNDFLDEVDARLKFRAWYAGHYHFDGPVGDCRHAVLFDQIVRAGDMPEEEGDE